MAARLQNLCVSFSFERFRATFGFSKCTVASKPMLSHRFCIGSGLRVAMPPIDQLVLLLRGPFFLPAQKEMVCAQKRMVPGARRKEWFWLKMSPFKVSLSWINSFFTRAR